MVIQDVINILASDNFKQYNILPLSFSKIGTIRCPKMFYNKYVIKRTQGIPIEKEPAVVGKFIHTVLQYCLDKGKVFGFEKEAIDFDLTWAQLAKQKALTVKEYDMAQNLRVHTENILLRLLNMIRTNNFQIFTELKFCMDIHGRMISSTKWANRFMFGFVDFFSIQNNKFGMVIDFKSFEKRKENAEELLIQTLIYTYFLLKKYTHLRSIQPGYIYIPDELFDADAVALNSNIDSIEQDIVKYFLDFIGRLDTAIQNNFNPITGDYCKWCGYYDLCELRGGKCSTKK